MTNDVTRKCRTCKEVKTLTEFTRRPKAPQGREYQCKACRSKKRYESGSYMTERLRKHTYRTGKPVYYTEKVEVMMKAATDCCYCNVKLTHISGAASQATFDHVYLYKNIDENLVVCCRACNTSKFQDHVYTFYQRSESFTDELFHAFSTQLASRVLDKVPTPGEVERVKAGLKLETEELQ
ncbi:MAG: hypothetical protein RR588_02060 [Solibacillus sp.]